MFRILIFLWLFGPIFGFLLFTGAKISFLIVDITNSKNLANFILVLYVLFDGFISYKISNYIIDNWLYKNK